MCTPYVEGGEAITSRGYVVKKHSGLPKHCLAAVQASPESLNEPWSLWEKNPTPGCRRLPIRLWPRLTMMCLYDLVLPRRAPRRIFSCPLIMRYSSITDLWRPRGPTATIKVVSDVAHALTINRPSFRESHCPSAVCADGRTLTYFQPGSNCFHDQISSPQFFSCSPAIPNAVLLVSKSCALTLSSSDLCPHPARSRQNLLGMRTAEPFAHLTIPLLADTSW